MVNFFSPSSSKEEEEGDGGVFHPTANAVESYFHASPLRTVDINNSMSSREFPNGPAEGFRPGTPSIAPETPPPNGILSTLGLNPYVPQQSEGMRIDPAMSVPTPSGEPLKATNAPSPPEDPPAVRVVLWGLSVRPKMLFSESAVYIIVSTVCILVYYIVTQGEEGKGEIPS